MPGDSSALDAALVAVLQADAALAAVMPDGVFFDAAPDGSTRFVLLTLTEEHDEPMFEGRAFEDAQYFVRAVALSASGADLRTAAARIDAVLHRAALPVTGFGVVTIERESRVRMLEEDDSDHTLRWQHRGGRYQVFA